MVANRRNVTGKSKNFNRNSVKPKGSAPLRDARASALHAWLRAVQAGGRVYVDAETLNRLRARGWTRSQVDKALDDLATSGRVTLEIAPGCVVARLVGGAS